MDGINRKRAKPTTYKSSGKAPLRRGHHMPMASDRGHMVGDQRSGPGANHGGRAACRRPRAGASS